MSDSLRFDLLKQETNLPTSPFIHTTTQIVLIAAIVYETVVLLSKAFSLAAIWTNRPSLANRVSLPFIPPISWTIGSCLILSFAFHVILIKYVIPLAGKHVIPPVKFQSNTPKYIPDEISQLVNVKTKKHGLTDQEAYILKLIYKDYEKKECTSFTYSRLNDQIIKKILKVLQEDNTSVTFECKTERKTEDIVCSIFTWKTK